MTAADELRDLEADYFDQPAHAQPADLARINALRAALGQLQVDARLAPVAPALAGHAAPEVAATVARLADGAEAYAAYLAREAALEPHRAYAQAVAKATHGSGMTPVEPLATLGTGGGPLRCDLCGDPMVLEGGGHHGWFADRAWAASPRRGWNSYISGGMVIDVETNGTLRVFHGYASVPASCLRKADRARADALALVDVGRRERGRGPLAAFLKHQFPDLTDIERGALLGRVLDSLYGFGPGVGVNRPEGA